MFHPATLLATQQIPALWTPEQGASPEFDIRHWGECRKDQLDFIADELKIGLEVVADLEHVNEILAASKRPDLTIEQRVAQCEKENFRSIEPRYNNFEPHISSWGPRKIDEEQEDSRWTIERSHPSVEELRLYFEVAARGDYDQIAEYTKNLGLTDRDMELAGDFVDAARPIEPILRSWIVAPDLFEFVIANCLNGPLRPSDVKPEIFAMYAIASRLVGIGDAYLERGSDGEWNDWFLCD